MLRIVTDASVQGVIVRGLQKRLPEIDLVRIDDVLPQGTPDPAVLAWAANEARVLLTHDRSTMIGFARKHFTAGHRSFGLIVTSRHQALRAALDDLEVIIGCMSEAEVRDRCLIYLPFRG